MQGGSSTLLACSHPYPQLISYPNVDADPILVDFLVKYPPTSSLASSLGVSGSDLYTALREAKEQLPNWNLQGREVDVWKELGYIA
jgi:hypothetical protein